MNGNNNDIDTKMNGNNNDYDDDEEEFPHVSLQEYIFNLFVSHRKEIYELSRENGYPLNNTSSFPFYKLKSSMMKLMQITSDSKMFEVISLHFEKTVPKSRNNTPENMKKNSKNSYSYIKYFYLNIQVNNTECIHVRIYSKDGDNQLQAILYKSINDPLRPF